MEGGVIADCRNCYHSEPIPFSEGVYCNLLNAFPVRVCEDYEGLATNEQPDPEVRSAGVDEVLRILEGG